MIGLHHMSCLNGAVQRVCTVHGLGSLLPLTAANLRAPCQRSLHGTVGPQERRSRCASGLFLSPKRAVGFILKQWRPLHRHNSVQLTFCDGLSSEGRSPPAHESARPPSPALSLSWKKVQRGRNSTALCDQGHGMRSSRSLPRLGEFAPACAFQRRGLLTGPRGEPFSRCFAPQRGLGGRKALVLNDHVHSRFAAHYASSCAAVNGTGGASSPGVVRRARSPGERGVSGLKIASGLQGLASKSESRKDTTENSGLQEARCKEILNNLPSYVRLVESGPLQVFFYPIVHGNSETASRSPGTSGCGTSAEASQLIRVLHPDFVFFSADPSAPKGGESSSSQFLGWLSNLGILPRVFGGFLPFSDIREPLAAADRVRATVGFLDRPKAATTNRLHQQLLQNNQYCRVYLDYASACRTLKQNSRMKPLGGEQVLKESSALSHQLMLSFPEGFETLVVERARYMGGRLAECLSSACMERRVSLAPVKDQGDLRESNTDALTKNRVVSVVVCDSVLAERTAHALKRIVGDPVFMKHLLSRNAGSHNSSQGDRGPPTVAIYKNPHEQLASAPPSQLPLLFFQIFVLPSLLAWLIMWQVQLLVGRGFGSHPLGDLPILHQAGEVVELDLGVEQPVAETGRGRRRFASGVNAPEESAVASDIACDSKPRSIHTVRSEWERFVPSYVVSLFSSGPLGRYTDRRS
ncbi:conserved hypothetical protein [Neospora caninum Liverpool]|uniref:Uncharacterized protein n=1 Tax=Neospora caninum (strain Liverpool) TaxID=572307 RepID=F0VKX7_NEOCL|nr:conserved hypothetical protein [Neospora caninum Liverpool]CBZ54728.1 conserved hypothetical protein [Neospora caninum Liverpool]CEL69444.1 TPA: hypothetical protein BN1204_051550 [Neospora caninum Liverpool]|eukprot:XP_003884758.1 conserved hypothetical protein [Neospora caninum Liverpool]